MAKSRKIILPKPKRGRPTLFSDELAKEVCRRIAEGESLRAVCRDGKMPEASTVFDWLRTKPEFTEQYDKAVVERSEAMAEDMIDIAEGAPALIKKTAEKKSGAMAQVIKLQVDVRKWHMGRMKPKKYGDKMDLTSDGKAIKGNVVTFKRFSDGAGGK